MDKRVIFAVAGSGKTALLIDMLSLSKRFLIITYTNANYASIMERILQKFGFFPANITLLTYYTFLYSFCYKPYLYFDHRTTGINYQSDAPKMITGPRRYFDSYDRLYSNRISKLLDEKCIINQINNRLNRYFDAMYIDEIQDFGGHDFNFLRKISGSEIELLYVGDFYQHTFDTSRDANVNKNLHVSYSDYKKQFRDIGLCVDEVSLSKSYRCSPTICNFISEKIGIKIESHRIDETEIVEINKEDEILQILNNGEIVKLFYKSHFEFMCYSRNWGECKGEDCYNNVCIVLNNKTADCLSKNKLHELPPISRNKLYVAISRTRNDLFFISEAKVKELKFQAI